MSTDCSSGELDSRMVIKWSRVVSSIVEANARINRAQRDVTSRRLVSSLSCVSPLAQRGTARRSLLWSSMWRTPRMRLYIRSISAIVTPHMNCLRCAR